MVDMGIFRLTTIAVLACSFVLSVGTATYSQNKNQQEINELKAELEKVQGELKAADEKKQAFGGGLILAFIEARIEILKITESLIYQRIQAIKTGAKMSIEVPAVMPNTDLVKELEQEIATQQNKIKAAEAESAKYSGGLVGGLRLASVATEEQTLSMLRQRLLSAKYGFPSLNTVNRISKATPELHSVPVTFPSEKSANDTADITTEILTVKLRRKRYEKRDFESYILFDIEFKAQKLPKPARAIKGILVLQDLFGEPQMRINWTTDKPIKPNEIYTEKGTGVSFNQFRDGDKWVKATDLENMTFSFIVKSIIFQDGSRKDY
ncbi:hypothetical protein N9B53_00970 [Mariniblastus sp.]|nr:hypothetical protein [Mariniblastus sp.]